MSLRRAIVTVMALASPARAVAQAWPVAARPPLTAAPELERAVEELALGRIASARDRLEAAVRARGVDPRGYDGAAVLLRVSAGVLPARREAASVEGLPPPPGDREVFERAVDGAVELLVRREARAATAWVESALAASPSDDPSHPLVLLGRVARAWQGRVATTARAQVTPVSGPLRAAPARPTGTVDGGEAVALYALGGAYGLAVGVWAAVGFTEGRDDRTALAIVLPVVGVGAGVVAAGLLDARRDVRRGRVYAANAGFYQGLLAAFGVDRLPSQPLAELGDFARASVYLGAATVGFGAGIAVAHTTDARPGSGSFALSGGLWGSFVGASLDRALSSRDNPASGVGMLVGQGVGLAAALATAHLLEPTPAQTRWLDLGALLGGLTGVLVLSQVSNAQTAALGSALGAVAGGTLGYVLGAPSEAERAMQRGLASTRAPLAPSFTPLAGGGLVTLSL